MISTVDFLRHVLPNEGWYAAFVPETKRHHWFDSPDRLAAAVLSIDQQQTVYYACAAFNSRESRSARNARCARSLWLDVDAGKDKPYVDAVDAAQAVGQFCRSTGLPDPIYVGSGYGVYAIWPLSVELGADAWRQYAAGLKHLCREQGLAADPARTSDLASILRAPGTHNRKFGKSVEVRCGPLVGPYPLEIFKRLLDVKPFGNERSNGIRAQIPRLAKALINSFEPEPKFAQRISEQCKQLGAMYRSHGRIAEPLWYACIGVLGYCEDGASAVHAWSAGHENYTYQETQEKFERVKTLSGATTCEHFHSLEPKACEACPHWQKIKSPISLGVQRAEASAEKTNIFGETLAPPQVDGLPELPHDFFWRRDGALITRSSTQRGDVDIVISRYPLYLEGVQSGEIRGEYNLVFQQRLPHHPWSVITITSRTLFSSSGAAELAGRGANIHDHPQFLRYLRSAIDLLHAQNKLTVRYDQFGWKAGETAFLYGLDLYDANGVQKVMGSDELQVRSKDNWVGPAKGGSLELWRHAINTLFAAGCEPQSVALLASFAAPLMRFQAPDEGGAILHLVSRESGSGKTTSLVGAASVWGQSKGLGLINEDTKISKALTLGALGNLPVIYDEITLRDPDAIRAFVINFTNGRDKMRATRAGEIHHTASTWQTILISAANTSLVDVLSMQNAPEAPAMRVIELNMVLPPEIKHAQGDKLHRALLNNAGYAGKAYLEWLVKPANLAWTKAMLERATEQTWRRSRWRSEYRFWTRTVAAIAVAGVIVKQLGLIDFSIDRIMSWLFEALKVGDFMDADPEPPPREPWALPALTEFLNQSIGNTVVMAGPYDIRKLTAPLQEPRQRLTIRYEISSRRYFIACTALREWLVDKELSYSALIKTLVGTGVITRDRCQITLGAGSNLPGGQVWCVEVNAAHEDLAGVAPVINENVVQIKPRASLT